MKSTKSLAAAAGIVALSAGSYLAVAQSQTQPPKQPDPSTTRPVQPTPRDRNTQPETGRPSGVQPRDTDQMNRDKYQRPFSFQTPQNENMFNDRTQGLMRMESQWTASQQRLVSKLAEARQLSGEKQNQALIEVLDQLVRDHGEMQRYLVQARTAWSGDLDMTGSPGTAPGGENRPQTRVPDAENPRSPK